MTAAERQKRLRDDRRAAGARVIRVTFGGEALARLERAAEIAGSTSINDALNTVISAGFIYLEKLREEAKAKEKAKAHPTATDVDAG